MDNFFQQLRGLGPGRLAAMAGVAIGLLGFIIFFGSRLTQQPMELLYSDLAPSDAKAMIAELDKRHVPYELRNGGSSVYVPANQQLKLRVDMSSLAQNGASMGYEVFDKMDSLGATSFVQNINLVRALEGELARTIMAIDGIKAARVHLVLPQRELFSREERQPSAAVYVKMDKGRLNEEQVQSIQHLVASSVPQLDPSRISMIDDHGSLLSSGVDSPDHQAASAQNELRRKEENRLARDVESLLESVLGPGKVRADVSADMNFSKVTTDQEIFDPDSQVARSSTTTDDQSQSKDAAPGGVSVANNLPNANQNTGGAGGSQSATKAQTTTNFEVSKKVINEVRLTPTINHLSVAVLVDGTYNPPAGTPVPNGADGKPGQRTYVPRTADEMTQLTNLVRTAMGYDAKRGDQVSVVNMQFQGWEELKDPPVPWAFLGFNKDEVMKLAEGLGVSIVAILVILLVVRPLISRAFEGAGAMTADGHLISDGNGMGAPQLMGPGGTITALIPEEEDRTEELIDIEKVAGRMKKSSANKISEIIDKHPDEAITIIRSWLYQEQA